MAAPAPDDAPPLSPTSRDEFSGLATGEAPSAPEPKRQGVVHSAARREAVYWLAAAVLGIAAVAFGLAIADAVIDARQLRPAGMSNWAFALIVLGIVHAAYALYLFQLPDWGTLRVASVAMIVTAAGFAMLLAVLSLGGGNLPLATSLQLDEFPDQRPELVCLIMLALSGLLGYLLGRASRRWHRSEQLLAASTSDDS